MKKNKRNVKKACVLIGLVIGAMLLTTFQYALMSLPENKTTPTDVGEATPTDVGEEWETTGVISNEDGQFVSYIVAKDGTLIPLGDYLPGGGGNTTGWKNMFLLDYGQTGETTEMKDNSTDWNASGNAMGYAEIDNWNITITNDDPFRFCIKAQFNETDIKTGGTWNHSRARVQLTVSGDENFGPTIACNDTAEGGTTLNNSVMTGYSASDDLCYMIFYWDDGVDGYVITDDGTLTISQILIQVKR